MKDNFSSHAGGYARYRPQYPQALIEYVAGFTKEKEQAWDCGTGNGQTAVQLSKYFNRVFATDISTAQLSHAVMRKNIQYAPEPAEHTSLAESSTDLITVSQALHWFNFDRFYSEVKRVAKPRGVIAVWTYSLLQVDALIDELIHHYHYNTLDGYWDEERKHVDEGYRNVPFPFKQVETPAFNIEVNWGLEDLEGYFHTWSALQKFLRENNHNPVPALMAGIREYWQQDEIKRILFPIHLKLGYVH